MHVQLEKSLRQAQQQMRDMEERFAKELNEEKKSKTDAHKAHLDAESKVAKLEIARYGVLVLKYCDGCIIRGVQEKGRVGLPTGNGRCRPATDSVQEVPARESCLEAKNDTTCRRKTTCLQNTLHNSPSIYALFFRPKKNLRSYGMSVPALVRKERHLRNFSQKKREKKKPKMHLLRYIHPLPSSPAHSF